MKQSVLIISALHYLCTQKKIRMGIFKTIKDIFSNDKGKETNTQENVSLPSSIKCTSTVHQAAFGNAWCYRGYKGKVISESK